MDIWTRTGAKIGNSKAVNVGAWALQDTLGVTPAFGGGHIRDTAKGCPPTSAALLGPWAFNVGATNS